MNLDAETTTSAVASALADSFLVVSSVSDSSPVLDVDVSDDLRFDDNDDDDDDEEPKIFLRTKGMFTMGPNKMARNRCRKRFSVDA